MIPLDDFLQRYAPVGIVADCDGIVLHQAARIFPVWEQWEQDQGAAGEVPFWAIAWPAARVLAAYILQYPDQVRNKRVLDVGCGSGLVSIACVKAGCRQVIANDVDRTALQLAQRNAALNRVKIFSDTADYLSAAELPDVDVLLIADMFYEKPQAERLTAFARRAERAGIRVLIADSGRNFAPQTNVAELWRRQVNVDADTEGVNARTVRILEYRWAGDAA